MKLYITGGTGFIGCNLTKFYKDCDIKLYCRGQNLQQELEHFGPDAIINSAAEIYQADLMWGSNVLLTRQCVQYVKDHSDCKMIQIGSSSEYGPLPRASKETDCINPIDMYQTTKGISTLLCQGYARTFNLAISVIRPYSVYGPGEKPHRLFPKLYKAFCYNEPMQLRDGVHDFIYIDDFIQCVNLVMQQMQPGQGHIINAGSGHEYTNYQVLKIFEQQTGRSAPVQYIPGFAKNFESQTWRCDTEYAREKYGFRVQFTLNQGIEKFLETAQY